MNWISKKLKKVYKGVKKGLGVDKPPESKK